MNAHKNVFIRSMPFTNQQMKFDFDSELSAKVSSIVKSYNYSPIEKKRDLCETQRNSFGIHLSKINSTFIRNFHGFLNKRAIQICC